MNELRFAIRQVLKNPGFTAVAVLTLALGIGANTAIFSLANTLLLKPISGHEPERLVGVYSRDTEKPDSYRIFSYPNFADLRNTSEVFEDVLAGDSAIRARSRPARSSCGYHHRAERPRCRGIPGRKHPAA